MGTNNNMREDRRLTESETREDLIRRFAYQYYLKRKRLSLPLNEKEDWKNAKEDFEHYEMLHNGVR